MPLVSKFLKVVSPTAARLDKDKIKSKFYLSLLLFSFGRDALKCKEGVAER